MAIRPVAPVRKLVIIEDGLVATMAANPDFVREFPFLGTLRGLTPSVGCGGCGRARADSVRPFSAAKQSIAGMSDDRRKKLKAMLNAQQVRVTYKNGSRIIQHTF